MFAILASPLVSMLLASVMRHALTAMGGYMVSQHWADPTSTNTFMGGAVALIGIIWSTMDKSSWASIAGQLGEVTISTVNGKPVAKAPSQDLPDVVGSMINEVIKGLGGQPLVSSVPVASPPPNA